MLPWDTQTRWASIGKTVAGRLRRSGTTIAVRAKGISLPGRLLREPFCFLGRGLQLEQCKSIAPAYGRTISFDMPQ
jgi:hypothetical protein